MRKLLQWPDRYWLWIIFCLALILRLSLAFVLPQDFMAGAKSDRFQYWRLANNLLDYKVFGYSPGVPDLSIPPGYPAFLALIYHVTSDRSVDGLPIRIVQAVVSALTLCPLYYIARRIYPSRREIVIVTILLFALHPVFILYSNLQLTETIYTGCLLLFLWRLNESMHSYQPRDGFVVGLLLGVTLLVREVMVVFPIFIFFLGILHRVDYEKLLRYNFALITGMMLIISPWIWRNSRLTGQFTFITGRSDSAMHLLNRDRLKLQTLGEQERQQHQYTFDAARYATFSDMLNIHFLLSDPHYYIWLIVTRLELVWLHPNGLASLPHGPLQIIYRVVHGLILLLAGFGVWEAIKNQRAFSWTYIALWLYTIGIHLFLSTATPRYTIPVLPFIIMFAVAGFFQLLRTSFHSEPDEVYV